MHLNNFTGILKIARNGNAWNGKMPAMPTDMTNQLKKINEEANKESIINGNEEKMGNQNKQHNSRESQDAEFVASYEDVARNNAAHPNPSAYQCSIQQRYCHMNPSPHTEQQQRSHVQQLFSSQLSLSKEILKQTSSSSIINQHHHHHHHQPQQNFNNNYNFGNMHTMPPLQ